MKLAMQIVAGKDVITSLRTASQRVKGALVRGVTKAALIVEREAKAEVYAGRPEHLMGDKGRLRQSITHQPEAGGLAQVIGPNVIYAAVHEFGATIRAKNAPYLVFQVKEIVQTTRKTKTGETVPTQGRKAGGWVRVKEVHIPARPYMKPSLEAKHEEVRSAILDSVYEVIL